MKPLELMIVGCLASGPLEGTELMEILSDQELRAVSEALQSLRRQERVVTLESGRFALVYAGLGKAEEAEDGA